MDESKVDDPMDDDPQCPDSFRCPITQEVMHQPVMLIADGHTYEQAALRAWFDTGRRISPLTGESIASTNTRPNHVIHKIIDEYRQRYPEYKQDTLDQKSLWTIIKLREHDLQMLLNKANRSDLDDIALRMSTVSMIDVHSHCIEDELREFLVSLNLSEYIETFERERMTMEALRDSDKDDLKEIGVSRLGDRKKILIALKQHNQQDQQINRMTMSDFEWDRIASQAQGIHFSRNKTVSMGKRGSWGSAIAKNVLHAGRMLGVHWEVMLVERDDYLSIMIGYLDARDQHQMTGLGLVRKCTTLFADGCNDVFLRYNNDKKTKLKDIGVKAKCRGVRDRFELHFDFVKRVCSAFYNGQPLGAISDDVPDAVVPMVSIYHMQSLRTTKFEIIWKRQGVVQKLRDPMRI